MITIFVRNLFFPRTDSPEFARFTRFSASVLELAKSMCACVRSCLRTVLRLGSRGFVVLEQESFILGGFDLMVVVYILLDI